VSEAFLNDRIHLFHGDSRQVLKGVADVSIDSVVCDPPYALVSIGKRFGKPGSAAAQHGKDGLYARASAGFMGQQWDTGETAWREGFSAILIEREATYCDDIRRRMALCLSGPDERRRESLKARGTVADAGDLPLFAGGG